MSADDHIASCNNSVSTLSREMVQNGLSILGKHPLSQKHAYLQFQINHPKIREYFQSNNADESSSAGANARGSISHIDVLSHYTHLVYVDISNQNISNLRPLEKMTCLQQLIASHNSLRTCLQYFPAKCDEKTKWSEGGQAIGSMLTLADLSHNQIDVLNSIDHHPFLEVLLLGHNSISSIQGLSRLQNLKVLDLSHNKLSLIQGLDYLQIQELNLSGNDITTVSGLSYLPHLSVLDISKNRIRSLYHVEELKALTNFDISYNDIEVIKEVENLSSLEWLRHLKLEGNPCVEKLHYRLRVIYRIQGLLHLDQTPITAEEKIQAMNLYEDPRGDIFLREQIYRRHFPNETYISNADEFCDEEKN